MTERLDRLGALASSLCAVHCAVCALLPAAFGALGLGFLLGHEAEWLFTLIAIAFALGALTVGWRRHRSVIVAGLLTSGVAGLLTARGLEVDAHVAGTTVGIFAGLLLVSGHVLNVSAARRCRQSCCP